MPACFKALSTCKIVVWYAVIVSVLRHTLEIWPKLASLCGSLRALATPSPLVTILCMFMCARYM